MHEERIHVADSKIPRCHAFPACAAVRAHAKTGGDFRAAIRGRGCAIYLAGIGFGNQHAMRIGVYIVDGCPSLAAIRALEKTADFHSDVNGVRIFRVKGDALHVRLMGRAGESPLLHARHLPQTGKLRPAFSEIVGIIKMGGLRSGIGSRASPDLLRGQGIDLLVYNALIPLLPTLAVVTAGEYGAVITSGKERFARRLEDDRTNMLVGQHGLLLVPLTVLLNEREDTVDGPDQEPVLRRLPHCRRLTSR